MTALRQKLIEEFSALRFTKPHQLNTKSRTLREDYAIQSVDHLLENYEVREKNANS